MNEEKKRRPTRYDDELRKMENFIWKMVVATIDWKIAIFILTLPLTQSQWANPFQIVRDDI